MIVEDEEADDADDELEEEDEETDGAVEVLGCSPSSLIADDCSSNDVAVVVPSPFAGCSNRNVVPTAIMIVVNVGF